MRQIGFLAVAIVLLSLSSNSLGQRIAPRTIREYFMILPEKYFYLEICLEQNRKRCTPTRKRYLKHFLRAEDNVSGYLEAGGDAAQDKITIRMLKSKSGKHLFVAHVFGEDVDSYYFLRYRNKKWIDVTKKEVPRYNSSYNYKIPETGYVIAVQEVVGGDQSTGSEIGLKTLFNLLWNGRNLVVRSVR